MFVMPPSSILNPLTRADPAVGDVIPVSMLLKYIQQSDTSPQVTDHEKCYEEQ